VYHSDGNWSSTHQCERKGKYEEGGYLWCGTHKPSIVAERKAAREAKWRAEWDAKDAESRRQEAERKLKDAALDAIRKIAAGHNDPRGLAQEILAEHSCPTPPEN
jgi:hypothetical protein